jgi:hypothetical protein
MDGGTPPSGGAHFKLAAVSTGGDCPDIGADVTIATVGTDGKQKLLTDGQGGANVSCKYDDKNFDVLVQDSKGNFVTATGPFDAGKATGTALMRLSLASGSSYKSGSAATSTPASCTVKFDQSSGGKLLGHFLCPEIDHVTQPGKMCAVSADGGTTAVSYFQFTDCTGF